MEAKKGIDFILKLVENVLQGYSRH